MDDPLFTLPISAQEAANQSGEEKLEQKFQVLERTVVKRGDHSIIYQRVAPPPPAALSPPAPVPAARALSPQELEAQQRREEKQHSALQSPHVDKPKSGMDCPRNTRKGAKGTRSEIDVIHLSGESGSFCKRLHFRAFRRLHCRI